MTYDSMIRNMADTLDPKSLAQRLGVHPETIRRWLRAGAPALKGPGRKGRWMIDLQALRRWLEAHQRRE